MDKFTRLAKLVDEDADNEIQCGECLQDYAHLLPGIGIITKLKIREFTSSDGRCDLIVVCKPLSAPAEQYTAKIYELKSPAKHVFKLDISKIPRFIPTRELIDAETQLLWYMQHFIDSRELETRYKASKVEPGGIIIGRRKTMYQYTEKEKSVFKNFDDFKYCCDLSYRIRTDFYSRSNIILLTWDDVIEIIQMELTEKRR